MPRLAALLALSLAACGAPIEHEPYEPPAVEPTADAGAPRPDARTETAASPAPEPAPTCEARIEARGLEAPSEAHARFVRCLPEIVVHGRVTPVLFLRWPDEAPRGDAARVAREAIERSRRPHRAVRALLEAHAGDRAFLREVLLSDGYLFARRPDVARALSAEVDLEALFDAPRIVRERDGQLESLSRGDDGYLDPEGAPARLRLHDRVGVELPDAPLGIALEPVRAQTGALRTLPLALGEDAAALTLVFPDGTRRPALVELTEGRTEVACVGGDLDTLQETVAHAARFRTRHARITAAARLMASQRVRFDEPIGEPEGVQEDGRLRQAWWQAYRAGRTEYVYRDVTYPVFADDGEARPPQVCIDFVLDAYDRALDAFYRPAGEAPGREPGGFADVEGLPRRNVSELIRHSATDARVFDRWDVPRRDRVSLSEGRAYARAAGRWAEEVREGDLLVIHGLRLQDGRLHNHAILVLRTEPITGVPMVVADNQGRAHLRSLVGAMRAAPLRAVKQRLRPRFDLL